MFLLIACFLLIRLKGQCHEIFDSHLFSANNTPGPLVHRLKPF
jgi:hypothetical protein